MASAGENFNACAHEPPCQATALNVSPVPMLYNTITRPCKLLPNFYTKKAGDCSGDCSIKSESLILFFYNNHPNNHPTSFV